MTQMTCRAARPMVRWSALEGTDPDSPVARHVAGCLRCQAEAARARSTARRLSTAFEAFEVPPAAVLGTVMAATFDTASDDHRIPAVPAVAVAAAAGAVFLIRRHQLSSR